MFLLANISPFCPSFYGAGQMPGCIFTLGCLGVTFTAVMSTLALGLGFAGFPLKLHIE